MRLCVTTVPPHPGPLPPGEGETQSVSSDTGRALSTERGQGILPLPAGEGRVRENGPKNTTHAFSHFTLGRQPTATRPNRDHPALPQTPSCRKPATEHTP